MMRHLLAALPRPLLLAGLLLAELSLAGPARASGGEEVLPWPIDPYGGSPSEQDAFYAGQPGVLMGRAPWARLFAAWRMLHGLTVGAEIGKSLAVPCCGSSWDGPDAAIKLWVAARTAVPGVTVQNNGFIDTFRPVGDFMAVQTCFADAFTTAARTIGERIAAHGADDRWVRAWLDGQDTVFGACSRDVELSPLDPAAPAWLQADRAYQEAALRLYRREFGRAEQLFLAIAADPASPWRKFGPYLAARAAFDAALPSKDPAAFATARTRLAALDPADAFGHADLPVLAGALDFRDRPDSRRRELATQLAGPSLPPTAAADFKDSRRLGQSPPGDPGYLDWIAVFGRPADTPEAGYFEHYQADQVWPTDAGASAHARAQWATTKDPAWLVAALAWSAAGAGADDLVAASRALPADSPAFLTALYHRARLAGAADPASTRAELDAALTRTDLSLTSRNLLTAERLLAAADLAEVARLARRDSPCVDADGNAKGCVSDQYGEGAGGSTQRPDIRFGDEAQAVIDRLPMEARAALAETDTLAAPLRVDLALTTWARAVLAQDAAIGDRMAGLLRALLPQLQPEWSAFLAAKGDADRRFAAWFIMAKMPGLDIDLRGGGYTRPQGEVHDFDGHWRDVLYARGAKPAPVTPPAVEGDLVCFGMCGPGAFPFRLPAFVSAAAPAVAAERGRFAPADAKAAASVWEDVLAYAKAHPKDPRTPEALYWVVRVSRFGTGHNRSSFRAWTMLHKTYPASTWTKESKYFYD